MRECGFYWVNFEIGEEIAYWNGSFWTLTGDLYHFQDNNFASIDENKIKRE
jgi:hypothetical protein